MIYLDLTLVKDTARRELGRCFTGKEGIHEFFYEFPYGVAAQPIPSLAPYGMVWDSPYTMPGGKKVKVVWTNIRILRPLAILPLDHIYFDGEAEAHIEELKPGEATLAEAYEWCKCLHSEGLYWLGDEDNIRALAKNLGLSDEIAWSFINVRKLCNNEDRHAIEGTGLEKYIEASYLSVVDGKPKAYTPEEIKEMYRHRHIYTDITDEEMCTGERKIWWNNGEI